MHNIIQQHRVIAILRNTPSEDLKDYVQALYDGGLRAFEVSFSAKEAADQLSWVKEHLPADACVGAGTILSADSAREALQAGADFMLSPSSDVPVLEFCRTREIPLLPGVFSPTDVSLCLSYGYHTLKLFPAADLPLHYIKSLKGPFPQAEFVAVGGITPENSIDYFRAGFAGVGIGSALTDKILFSQKNWAKITENIRDFLKERRNL